MASILSRPQWVKAEFGLLCHNNFAKTFIRVWAYPWWWLQMKITEVIWKSQMSWKGVTSFQFQYLLYIKNAIFMAKSFDLFLLNVLRKRSWCFITSGGETRTHMSMGWCKKDVTPLLTHWSYLFLALTQRCIPEEPGQYHWCWSPGPFRRKAISSNGIDHAV